MKRQGRWKKSVLLLLVVVLVLVLMSVPCIHPTFRTRKNAARQERHRGTPPYKANDKRTHPSAMTAALGVVSTRANFEQTRGGRFELGRFIFHCNCWRMWRLLLGVLLGSAVCLVVNGGGTAASDGSCSSEKGVQLVGYNMYVTQASKQSTQAAKRILFFIDPKTGPHFPVLVSTRHRVRTHCCDRESCCPRVQTMSGIIV